jgi:hypothetical protein
VLEGIIRYRNIGYSYNAVMYDTLAALAAKRQNVADTSFIRRPKSAENAVA